MSGLFVLPLNHIYIFPSISKFQLAAIRICLCMYCISKSLLVVCLESTNEEEESEELAGRFRISVV